MAVTTNIEGGVATVTLDRPEKHNAFDEAMIGALTVAFGELGSDDNVRVVLLGGRGKSFCAGADLEWMRRSQSFGAEDNLADAGALADMLHRLYTLPKPTVAVVDGAALGGGVGLVAACDIAIASEKAVFALSEARLGLVPATIGPYVAEAIGVRACRRYFLSAERFDARRALRLGLVHEVVGEGDLGLRVASLIGDLLACGPMAQATAKALLRRLAGREIDVEMRAETAALIAEVRSGAEARDGIASFLDKRAPRWVAP